MFPSVYISTKDDESGLKSITASIYDKTLKITVWSDTRPALTLQPADSKRKRVSNVLSFCWLYVRYVYFVTGMAKPVCGKIEQFPSDFEKPLQETVQILVLKGK